jgi:dynein heavy chain, axonemal
VDTAQDFVDMLRQYPIAPKPEIFGLHDNADITCDQNETYDLFATVLSLQPRVASGGGVSRDDAIMAQCQAIVDKLPDPFDVDDVQRRYPTMYEESMNTVLSQECIRCVLFGAATMRSNPHFVGERASGTWHSS